MSARLTPDTRAQADWRREVDTVTQLQGQLASLTEQLARSQAADGKATALREKLAASNAANSELRSRVRQLEEQNEKRDGLVKDWSLALGGFEAEVRRLAEENQQLVREQETVKSALLEIGGALTDNEIDPHIDDLGALVATVRILASQAGERLGRPTDRGSRQAREDTVETLQAEITRLQNKNEQLALENEQLRIQATDRSESDVERLMGQVEKYQAMLQEQGQIVAQCGAAVEQEKVKFELAGQTRGGKRAVERVYRGFGERKQ